jgi:hypothetical protein
MGNPIGLKNACSIEAAAVTLRTLIGSIDGAQQAANETRNTVLKFGHASATAFKVIEDNLNKDRLITDADT